MKGGWRLLLAAALLAAALSVVPPSRGGPAFPAPANPASVDLDPWHVGDRWTYATRAITRTPDGAYTDTNLSIEARVVEVRGETVDGRAYTVYNATTAGTVATQGRIPVPGLGPQSFSLSGTSSGWTWTDRSDLATVRTNQTGSASGTVTLPFPLPPATITATLAATVTFDPAAEDHDFPLEEGDAWSYDVRQATTGFARYVVRSVLGTFENTTDLSGTNRSRMAFWFNATQDVTVPAGAFAAAARIEAEGGAGGRSVRWHHPAAKNVVKMESHVVNGPDDYAHTWTNLTAMTLMAPPWPGTIALSPARVSPGGWLNASGVARPNEDLLVRIPASGAAFPARADGTGTWTARIRAPVPDDFTPANADAGSHGVLVDGAGPPAGWDVATVQLILPDLYADPGGPGLTPSVPAAGIPVTLNGTVRASPAVNVSSAFNVSFTVDSVEVGRSALSGLAAGEAWTFTATWTPTPGWHTVAFVVDPEDEVRERDEGNNTAARAVFVAGPDLVPVNLTLEGEGTASYPDPGAVGFVSPPIQGRLGGFVNVTFEVANVGGADAGPFAVRVVRTVGLRGPPAGPPALLGNASALAAGERAGPWTASWPVPTRAGVYHLNVTADADGQVVEAFEGNNTFVVVVNVSGPDYGIAGVLAPAKATTSVTVSIVATVRNDGQLAGDRPAVLAGFEGASPTPFGTVSVEPLSAGERRDVTLPWVSPPSGGVRALRLVVDHGDDLEEMDEGNNEATATVDVRDRPSTRIAWTGPNVTAQTLFVTDATRFVLTAEDPSEEGLTTWYRAGGAPVVYVGPFTLSGDDGSRVIEYWSVDNLGGRETERRLPVSLDTTPPAVRTSVGDRVGNRTVVTLTVTDDGVGVAYVEVRVDNGSWRPYDGPFPVEGYGDHVVAFRAVDLLENARPEESLSWTIARPAPVAGNVKPLLAVALAALLLGLGVLRWRRGARWALVSAPSVALAFAVVELATGVASLAVPALAVPPVGLGLAVDLAVFGTGAILVLLGPRLSRPAEATAGSAEEEADPRRDGEEQERDRDVEDEV